MNKQIITFDANEQSLIKTGGLDIYASKTVSYIEAHFDLGENWSGYDSVEAVWWNDYVRPVRTVLDTEGVCVVPTEVLLRKSVVYVNLVGVIASGNTLTDRLTTVPITALTVKFNAQLGEGTTTPLTPSEYEQFVATVKADADRAETAKEGARGYAESASASASSASASASNASTSETNAHASEVNAKASEDNAKISELSASASAESASEDAGRAENAKDAVLGMRAEATTLEPNESATASYSDGVLTLGIPKGVKGDRGQQGIQGETGATPNFTIGTVETLEPTEDATATITGTAENPVLNLGIPQGEVGEVSYADLKTLLPMDTASGSIVSITDGQSVIPVESLKVSLEPIQDLHGYDRPWVGGGGKNILSYPYASATGVYSGITYTDNLDGTITANGTATSTAYFNLVKITTPKDIKAGTYTYSVNGTGGRVNINIYTNGRWVSQGSATDGTPITFTVQEDTTYYAFFAIDSGVTVNNQKFHLQLETGTTATDYEPYSNICPISGRTEVVTQRTGKNLLKPCADGSNVDHGITMVASDGKYTLSGTSKGIFAFDTDISLKGGETYTFSFNNPISALVSVYIMDADNNILLNVVLNSENKTSTVTFANDVTKMRIRGASGLTLNNFVMQPMAEVGTTATAYEPYEGETYTTDLGRTVYGGTLDVVSGELTVTHAMVDLGDLSWSYENGSSYVRFYSTGLRNVVKKPSTDYDFVPMWCSALNPTTTSVIWQGVEDGIIAFGNTGTLNARLTNYTDATAFKTAMSGVQLCYVLATPTTYQLTPQEVKLLLGNNTIWSDGDVAIVYSADVTKWIEKQLS